MYEAASIAFRNIYISQMLGPGYLIVNSIALWIRIHSDFVDLSHQVRSKSHCRPWTSVDISEENMELDGWSSTLRSSPIWSLSSYLKHLQCSWIFLKIDPWMMIFTYSLLWWQCSCNWGAFSNFTFLLEFRGGLGLRWAIKLSSPWNSQQFRYLGLKFTTAAVGMCWVAFVLSNKQVNLGLQRVVVWFQFLFTLVRTQTHIMGFPIRYVLA